MADGGFTFTKGFQAPQQGGQGGTTGSSSRPDAIFKASTLIENKRREAMRQYERAQTMMREDLKTMHGFDNTVGGFGQFSTALEQAAELARQQIKEAKNPIQAQEIITAFKAKYNFAKSRQELSTDPSKAQSSSVTSSSDEWEKFNDSLGIDQEYVRSEASEHASAQQTWDNPYEGGIQEVDGEWMAMDPIDGQLKALTDIEATLNTSMFDLKTQQITSGSIGDWAMEEGVKIDIGWNGGKWDESRAGQIYDDNILQIGRKEQRTEMGEWHRRQVLNTLEQRGLIDIFSPEERTAFIKGVWESLDEPKTRKVIAKGREIFIEESKFAEAPSDDSEGLSVERGLVTSRISGGARLLMDEWGGDLEDGESVVQGEAVILPMSDIGTIPVSGEFQIKADDDDSSDYTENGEIAVGGGGNFETVNEILLYPSTLTALPNGNFVLRGQRVDKVTGTGAGTGELQGDYEILLKKGTPEYERNRVVIDQALSAVSGHTLEYFLSDEQVRKLRQGAPNQDSSGGIPATEERETTTTVSW